MMLNISQEELWFFLQIIYVSFTIFSFFFCKHTDKTNNNFYFSFQKIAAHKVLTDVLCIRGTVWSLREAVSLCSKILARPNLKASEKKPFQTQSEKLLLKLVESEKQQQESKNNKIRE